MGDLSQDDPRPRAQDGPYSDHLLPGEMQETDDPSVIERWIEVYAQLLSAKRASVHTLMQRLRRVRPEVREELEHRDLELLDQEMRRVKSRLDFWLSKRLTDE